MCLTVLAVIESFLKNKSCLGKSCFKVEHKEWLHEGGLNSHVCMPCDVGEICSYRSIIDQFFELVLMGVFLSQNAPLCSSNVNIQYLTR